MKWTAALIVAALCTGSAVGQTAQCVVAYSELNSEFKMAQFIYPSDMRGAVENLLTALLAGRYPDGTCDPGLVAWVQRQADLAKKQREAVESTSLALDLDIILRAKKEDEK